MKHLRPCLIIARPTGLSARDSETGRTIRLTDSQARALTRDHGGKRGGIVWRQVSIPAAWLV